MRRIADFAKIEMPRKTARQLWKAYQRHLLIEQVQKLVLTDAQALHS